MECESDGDTNYCWNGPQRLGKKPEESKNQGKNRDSPDYSIGEIGQNTQKSPGNLRRLVVTQTSVKNVGMKNFLTVK